MTFCHMHFAQARSKDGKRLDLKTQSCTAKMCVRHCSAPAMHLMQSKMGPCASGAGSQGPHQCSQGRPLWRADQVQQAAQRVDKAGQAAGLEIQPPAKLVGGRGADWRQRSGRGPHQGSQKRRPSSHPRYCTSADAEGVWPSSLHVAYASSGSVSLHSKGQGQSISHH